MSRAQNSRTLSPRPSSSFTTSSRPYRYNATQQHIHPASAHWIRSLQSARHTASLTNHSLNKYSTRNFIKTSSSAVAKRPRDASGLSVCFIASIMQYLERNFLLWVTLALDLLVCTIWLHSVVFGVTSRLVVIHTIHCPPWLCIVRERAWSVSRCRTTATLTGYRAWRLVVEYPHTHNKRKAGRRCDLQARLQQLLIAKPDIRWESRF